MRLKRRWAAALLVVIVAIALLSALAVGGTFVTRQLASSVRTAQRAEELEPVAEGALVQAIIAWDSASRAEQPIGMSSIVAVSPSPRASVDVWVTRLSESTYWFVAQAAVDVRPPLRRRIGVLVRVSGGAPALVPQRAWSDLP